MKRPGKRFAAEVKEAMTRHPWTGNIRELENAVQRAVALSDGEEIGVRDLLESPQAPPDPRTASAPGLRELDGEGLDLDQAMAEIETGYLRRALEMSKGSYTKAAQLLKMSLRSFRYKLQKYNLVERESESRE
jgi:DNA-binding NtrC family response regulator